MAAANPNPWGTNAGTFADTTTTWIVNGDFPAKVEERKAEPSARKEKSLTFAQRLPKGFRQLRRKILAAKIRAAGAKSPMHLAAMQSA
jgi:hypothetical protein